MDQLKKQNDALEEKLLHYADYDQLKVMLAKSEVDAKKVADARVKAKEDEFSSLLEEKELNWSKKEHDLNNTINKMKKQVEDLKVNEEMMKLRLKKNRAFGSGDDDDADTLAERSSNDVADDVKETIKDDDVKDKTISSMEFELLTRDLDTYKLRTMDLEKRNEELRRELSLTKSEAAMDKAKETSNNRILALESENALVVAKLEHERKQLDNLKLQDKKKFESLGREINQLSLEVDNLKEIKAKTLDYDDIKKELDILKQVEFGFDINLDEVAEKGETQVIDSAIIQRNKKLKNEVIEFRAKNEELMKQNKELELQLKDSHKQKEILQDMNNKLESDLLNVENGAVHADKWETMSMISSIAPSTIATHQQPRGSRGGPSPTSSIVGGNAGLVMGASNGAIVDAVQDSSILPIITQQRDRFRIKNKELEEESKKQFSKIVELKREINNLKSDNRELYERIRFLQYHKDNAAKSAPAASN
ncbi:unnamed protein product [Ambrosiozyma monospora]|uniref:Unnamed protein product n=1 Tax=Ambrosiozyma monospora TaxID=43982 RepID=A0ACB5T5Y8_AMBMO|nr:unnamed protein product [Ambrosiozyma monospora]